MARRAAHKRMALLILFVTFIIYKIDVAKG